MNTFLQNKNNLKIATWNATAKRTFRSHHRETVYKAAKRTFRSYHREIVYKAAKRTSRSYQRETVSLQIQDEEIDSAAECNESDENRNSSLPGLK